MTGKLERQQGVEGRRALGAKILKVMDRELSERPFLAGDAYTIADISNFAYSHLAGDAGFDLAAHTHIQAWIERIRSQPGFLAETHPYSIDPYSVRDLP